MAESTISFGEDGPPAFDDGRFNAPSFHRNRKPYEAVLQRYLAGEGAVLEIGSGTGQHVTAYGLAFPDIDWWPSDPNPDHRKSVSAWVKHLGLGNVRAPINLDASLPDWRLEDYGQVPETGFAAVYCMNVIHISPWPVACGLLSGAGRHLRSGGHFFLYGPFKRNGEHTAASNAEFDRSLRSRDESWGIRDMGDVVSQAEDSGLDLVEAVEMPSNNFTLVFQRA